MTSTRRVHHEESWMAGHRQRGRVRHRRRRLWRRRAGCGRRPSAGRSRRRGVLAGVERWLLARRHRRVRRDRVHVRAGGARRRARHVPRVSSSTTAPSNTTSPSRMANRSSPPPVRSVEFEFTVPDGGVRLHGARSPDTPTPAWSASSTRRPQRPTGRRGGGGRDGHVASGGRRRVSRPTRTPPPLRAPRHPTARPGVRAKGVTLVRRGRCRRRRPDRGRTGHRGEADDRRRRLRTARVDLRR